MTGDFIYRHREVPQSKLYVPKEQTFPILLNYIDVTGQTRTGIDNSLELTLKEYWDEEKAVAFFEDWIGTTRFQILRTRLPEGCKWVCVRP